MHMHYSFGSTALTHKKTAEPHLVPVGRMDLVGLAYWFICRWAWLYEKHRIKKKKKSCMKLKLHSPKILINISDTVSKPPTESQDNLRTRVEQIWGLLFWIIFKTSPAEIDGFSPSKWTDPFTIFPHIKAKHSLFPCPCLYEFTALKCSPLSPSTSKIILLGCPSPNCLQDLTYSLPFTWGLSLWKRDSLPSWTQEC